MRKVLLSIVFVLALVGIGRSDEVVLKNGDRLSGKVIDLAGGKLRFKTEYAGELLLDWAQISAVTTEGKVQVKLETGEVVEGKLSSGEGGLLKIESEQMKQPVEVDPAKVKKINEKPTEWHGSIDLGVYQTAGNTRKTNAILSINLLRETERDRFQIKADYRYGRDRKVTTERKAYGLIKYDYKFSDRFYGWVAEELTHDYFKDLRIGTFTSGGVGYTFVKETHTDLAGEVGLAYATNDHYLGKDEGHLAGRLFVHFRQDLFLGLVFMNDFTWYPNFERWNDWQARDEASISAGLGAGLTARVGAIWEYDHEPSPGNHRFDILYFVTLGYRF